MKWTSRKFLVTFLFCTGAAIAGGFMIYIATDFNQIRDAISTALQYQLGAIGAYQGGNVLSSFSTRPPAKISNLDGE